jgi:hypothetical protein
MNYFAESFQLGYIEVSPVLVVVIHTDGGIFSKGNPSTIELGFVGLIQCLLDQQR